MNLNMCKKAICILSGGMDSTLTSYIAKNDGYDVIAVHYSYGQRTQTKELESFRKICTRLNTKKKYEINIPFFTDIGASALTDRTIDVPINGIDDKVPATYVPFRNGIFISIAAAIAEKEKATAIFIGVVEEDSSGYPDCTNSFIHNMQNTINQGTQEQTSLKIITPLINLAKKDIVKRSIDLQVPLELTWSCYKNENTACGVCDSCRLRLKGFKLANIEDKIKYTNGEL
ncbi:Queuosine Biosynthesis QueC ATPase [hydrothermal vent metagenome]|uniref:7-cyano-7-deazaguanine synthase n=1 Tax=hydrothermal vent metagenome TaxID=652676 RepID=A0A3B1E7R2_9ZZZZ